MPSTAEKYLLSNGHSLIQFYEKLFFLKARMNMDTGKELAEQRHRLIENFVAKFVAEWHIGGTYAS